MATKLKNIRLGYSSISGGSIYLYRHGKDPALALEKREASSEVFGVITKMMLDGTPQGSEMSYSIGDKKYLIRVTPLDTEGI